MQEEDEDEVDEVAYEEEKMDLEPHIDLKETEGGRGIENMAGPICQDGTSQPPDEEQAGLEAVFCFGYENCYFTYMCSIFVSLKS